MKKKKRRIIGVLLCFLVGACGIGGGYLLQKKNVSSKAWYEKYSLIAHAMGAIDDITYTNSLEAFELSYKNGFRVFETDFTPTSDGVLVGRHSWKKNKYDDYSKDNIPTSEEFLNNPTYGKYTGVTFETLLQLASEHPEIYFITDTKETGVEENRELWSEVVSIAEDMDMLDILKKQFIIQIYNEEMLSVVQEIVAPENILFTLYKLEIEEYPETIKFCGEHGIPVVTMRQQHWTAELQELADEYDISLALHTINNPDKANDFLEKGVATIYTDKVTPKLLKNASPLFFKKLYWKIKDTLGI